jgi:hypothetical protein
VTYDHNRIWLLAVFCVAAKKEIPHGAEWAAKAAGFFAPPSTINEMSMAATCFRRPIYKNIASERIRLSSLTKHNRLMTGLKASVEVDRQYKLTNSERGCVLDLIDFIKPVLDGSPRHCQESIQQLFRSLLQDKDLEIAA